MHKKLFCDFYVTFLAAQFLTSRVYGETIDITASGNYACTTTDEPCVITCNAYYLQYAVTVNCGSASECRIECTERQCFGESVFNAQNSDQLMVESEGYRCFYYSTFNLPDAGGAIFRRSPGGAANEVLRRITVNAGIATTDILIDCTGEGSKGCKDLTVDARTARFLRIVAGSGDYIDSPLIYCPRDNRYIGSEEAPCIIDVSAGGDFRYGDVYTVDGYPEDFVIYEGSGVVSSIYIYCEINGGDAGLWTPASGGICENHTGSPTAAPTAAPTVPTTSPTFSPTRAPTYSPSKAPTDAPTFSPTFSPSNAPTFSPSMSPTQAPTFCFGREIDVDEQVSNLAFVSRVNDPQQVRTATVFGEYLDARLSAFNHDQEQELQCVGAGACLGVHAVFADNTLCNIVCNASFACSLAHIQVRNCQRTEMICSGSDACTGAYIEVDNSDSDAYFELGHTQSAISCYDVHACDGMRVHINPDNYKNSVLNMYSFSTNVTFSNGFGLEEEDGSQSYVNCNTEQRFLQFNESSTDETLQSLVLDKYKNGLFPCDGLTIECFADNDTDVASSCELAHEVDTSSFNISDGCDWVAVADITRTTCIGDCQSSPTKAPTRRPTREPTFATSDPTNAPTTAPSVSPTNFPSQPPTASPTSSPTQSPSDAPSFSPTLSPSFSPTESPTLAPSFSPSSAPSFSPTNSPTHLPSVSPSSAPSFSPTQAPTRIPTEDADEIYDVKILVDYVLFNLSVENKRALVSDTKQWTQDMEEIIERSYYDEELLPYTAFWTHIYAINDVIIDEDEDGDAQGRRRRLLASLTEYDLDINNINGQSTTFSSEIQCADIQSGYIIQRSNAHTFLIDVQDELSELFGNNTSLVFDVSPSAGHDELEALQKFETDNGDDDMYSVAVALSIGILSGGLLATLCAFVFNKIPQTKVDNAAFLAPLLLSIGVYDFISDVNLSIQMFGYSAKQTDDVVFILAVLSVFFIILPLSANLWYACKITSQPSIRRNPAARSWFAKHLAQFVMLSFGCAGTYPVLVLCSSRIFGLEFFDAGLLSSDLYELSKIKIRSTVFMENIPQLALQIVYAIITIRTVGQIEDGTYLAFVASLLSIAAAMVVYEAQRKQNIEMEVTQYFVKFVHRSGTSLSEENRTGILQNKGKKEKLAKSLAAVFSANYKSIEIGFVFIRTEGCIVHLQHAVFKDDLERLQKKLYSQQLQTMGQGFSIHMNVHLYGQRLYEMHERSIDEVFRAHFGIPNVEFVATYHESYDASQNDNAVAKGEHKQADIDVANEMVKHLKKVHTRQTVLADAEPEPINSGLEMALLNTNQSRGRQLQVDLQAAAENPDVGGVAGEVDENMIRDMEKLFQQQQSLLAVMKQQLAKKSS